MDDDFYSVPAHNPAYRIIGPANGEYQHKLKRTIEAVTALTVPTVRLAERYINKNIHVIPAHFDSTCKHWRGSKLPAGRDTFTVGWAGTATHRLDFDLAFEAMRQFFTTNRQAQLVIGGDSDIYERFDFMGDERRQFLGYMQYEDYPSMYRYFDVLVAPLEDNLFNRGKSDIKLVEAGARGIPWLASPTGAYWSWELLGAGRLCETTEQWYEGLNFYSNMSNNVAAGKRGREAVRDRTAVGAGAVWIDLVEEVLNGA
jgi:glycosyltransferase involved in cell wall biosynthesis